MARVGTGRADEFLGEISMKTETTIQDDIKTIRDPLEWYARKHPTTQLAKECADAVAALKRLEKLCQKNQ